MPDAIHFKIDAAHGSEGSKGSMNGKLERAGSDDAFLAELLAAFG